MTGRHHHGAAPFFCFREALKTLRTLKSLKPLKTPKVLKALNVPSSSPILHLIIYIRVKEKRHISLLPPRKNLPIIAQTPCKCARTGAFLSK